MPKESLPAASVQKPLLRKPTGSPLRCSPARLACAQEEARRADISKSPQLLSGPGPSRPTLHLAAQPKQKDKQVRPTTYLAQLGEWRKASRLAHVQHVAAMPTCMDTQTNAAAEWDFITYGVHDVRPVGSRPLAYSRIKVPVVYSDTVGAPLSALGLLLHRRPCS